MATRTEPAAAKDLYDEDFYVWTEHQSDLLRARRFDELDLEDLIEEVEASGRAERSRVLGSAGVVIEHLLKLQFSPATDPRAGWIATVSEHRRRLVFDLTPRIRKILRDELPQLYALVRRDTDRVLRAHGEHAAADALPAARPYTPDEITGDWWP